DAGNLVRSRSFPDRRRLTCRSGTLGSAGVWGGVMIDEDEFEPLPPRRPLLRRKRVLIPLALLLALVPRFLALRTPDTDRDAMIARYGGADAQFAVGPAGQRIHYRDQGKRDAEALVLLHGSNSSLQTWEPLVRRLGDRYRIVTLDLPGHGLT